MRLIEMQRLECGFVFLRLQNTEFVSSREKYLLKPQFKRTLRNVKTSGVIHSYIVLYKSLAELSIWIQCGANFHAIFMTNTVSLFCIIRERFQFSGGTFFS